MLRAPPDFYSLLGSSLLLSVLNGLIVAQLLWTVVKIVRHQFNLSLEIGACDAIGNSFQKRKRLQIVTLYILFAVIQIFELGTIGFLVAGSLERFGLIASLASVSCRTASQLMSTCTVPLFLLTFAMHYLFRGQWELSVEFVTGWIGVLVFVCISATGIVCTSVAEIMLVVNDQCDELCLSNVASTSHMCAVVMMIALMALVFTVLFVLFQRFQDVTVEWERIHVVNMFHILATFLSLPGMISCCFGFISSMEEFYAEILCASLYKMALIVAMFLSLHILHRDENCKPPELIMEEMTIPADYTFVVPNRDNNSVISATKPAISGQREQQEQIRALEEENEAIEIEVQPAVSPKNCGTQTPTVM